MPALQPAHRGYEYQDLLCAMRLVDLTLGTLSTVRVDEKLVDDDRFDDLTVITAGGRHERTQFKHTDSDDKLLTYQTFTNDGRKLRLDRLVAAAIAYRDGPGSGAACLFRVILRDARPVEDVLAGVLVPAGPDQGPFVAGMSTLRLRFDVDRLWPLIPTAGKAASSPFDFLRSGAKAVDRADLAWMCERLIIEVEAPRSSGSLVEPGDAEQILLTRVRTEVGAGSYPNADRSAQDVSEAFAGYARQARQGLSVPSAPELLRRAKLRQDFGAVDRVDPVDHTIEVARPATLEQVEEAAEQAARDAVPLLLTGPPGQGKSWMSAQLVQALERSGWLVAEHFCYLNDTADQRDERVNAECVFGSLLGRLADLDGALVSDLRPRFAADEVALVGAVARAVQSRPDRPVALIVDGLDHVARIAPSRPGADPSAALAADLAALELPVGSVLIVLSQPGVHLEPLRNLQAAELAIPGLTEPELHELVDRFGLPWATDAPEELAGGEVETDFITALEDRSRGNALYATYLCREVLRHPAGQADLVGLLRSLPEFDGTLENYYSYLMVRVGPGAVVADVVGLLDFPVTRPELAEMRPELAHWLDEVLATLAPVLAERATQGGLRIYHESFARFLRRRMEQQPGVLAANLRFVIDWLLRRGFFGDERAFRYLLPALAAAGRDQEVLDLVGVDFASASVAAGHPTSAITANLVLASGSAARLRNVPALAQCVELARAAESFEYERLDSVLLEHVDVPLKLLGEEQFANRLLFDGKPSVPARAGLQLCAALDSAGVAPPWPEYIAAYAAWEETDNTSYGPESDTTVALAWLRGQLRQFSGDMGDVDGRVRIASYLNDSELPLDEVVPIVSDVLGIEEASLLIDLLDAPEHAALALAEVVCADGGSADEGLVGRLVETASRCYPSGCAHRLIELGAMPQSLAPTSDADLWSQLTEATRIVTSNEAMHTDGAMPAWLDLCTLASHRNGAALATIENMLDGEGWYRCWLRFNVALVQAEASPQSRRASSALSALELLTGDLRPFKGTPRACDLYPIHAHIAETLRRAVRLVGDDQWPAALSILISVADGLGLSLSGMDAGPLTQDALLSIAIEATTTQAHQQATQALVDQTLAEHGRGRYYSASAEYRLKAARLALNCGDLNQAREHWHEACRLMTSYGWRKDATVYEILEPLNALVVADLDRARVRLARAQATCERVVLHTDGRGTRRARAQWWAVLANADPEALVDLAVPALLHRCGRPYDLYNGALEDLWRCWQHRATPVVAALLRLALPAALEGQDTDLVERMAALADGSGSDVAGRLLNLLLARADERRLPESATASEEVYETTQRITAINAIAEQVNAQLVEIEPVSPGQPTSRRKPQPPQFHEQDRTLLPQGTAGIARAVRAWRRRPYESLDPAWEADRFANAIGYRLVELSDSGDEPGAVVALHTLATSTGLRDGDGLLASVGHGLERHGYPRLAAVAFALAWTHAGGHGGWVNFGGQTELDSLRRATALDPETALTTVASEIARAVADRRGSSYGVTQALIFALADGALAAGTTPLDTAFAAWDKAHAVIAARTPRMADDDDPDEPYEPQPSGANTSAPPDMDLVFAKAIIGGLAHPGQENRRRTLLAFTILLDVKLSIAAAALSDTLASLTDPGVLSWLLKVVDDAGEAARRTVALACQDTLDRLSRGPHLTVRALAARLLGDLAGQPPMTTPDNALLQGGDRLWVPEPNDSPLSDTEPNIAMLAEERLLAAAPMLPLLERAAVSRFNQALAEPGVSDSINREHQELSDITHRRWADAFTGRASLFEDALQQAAAGGRASLVASGAPPADPVAWEYALACLLVNDPAIPLAIEATRQPRPSVPPPPGPGDSAWSKTPPQKQMRGALTQTAKLVITSSTRPPECCAVLHAGRFQGWRIIAVSEEHTFDGPDLTRHPLRTSSRSQALELRLPDDQAGLGSPPFTIGRIADWFDAASRQRATPVSWRSRPLVGVDVEGRSSGLDDARLALGVHEPLLTPTPLLRSILGLWADETLILRDELGSALALITWRSHYETGGYHLPWPRRVGSAIAMRPTAFDKLLRWGEGRLSIREVIEGNSTFAEPNSGLGVRPSTGM
ncbi:AAA family ATPase [Streptomyces sp. NPDC059072]|uniref:AAA family ATPase n=1 Tax=Streptomyces sp. NPDC059072 TaxID=3346715 RepID=UPI0036CE9E84